MLPVCTQHELCKLLGVSSVAFWRRRGWIQPFDTLGSAPLYDLPTTLARLRQVYLGGFMAEYDDILQTIEQLEARIQSGEHTKLYYTLADLARLFGKPNTRVYAWRARGILRSTRTIGGRQVFYLPNVLQNMRQNYLAGRRKQREKLLARIAELEKRLNEAPNVDNR